MQQYKEHTFKMFHMKHFDELYKNRQKAVAFKFKYVSKLKSKYRYRYRYALAAY